MISFLNPFALAGLAALAVPVVVHLFKPRRVRVLPFTSLRWLRASQHRLSRRIQWHQLLLFLLRAAVLALLVLAAARPILSRRGGPATHRFVIVDAGRSMGYVSGGRPAPMERARNLAGRLVAEPARDRVTSVLVAGRSARALGPLTADTGRYMERIRGLSAEGSENPVTSALSLVSPLRRNAGPAEAVELFFVTANLAPSWSQTDIAAFMRDIEVPVRVNVLKTALGDPKNAWIASAETIEADESSPRRIRVQMSSVGDREQERVLRVSGVAGMPEAQRDVRLEPGRAVFEEFELPPALDLEDQVALLTLDPPDALPDDDRFWVRLKPRGERTVLVVEPDSTHVRELRPAFHLRAALGTLSETMPGRFSTISQSPQSVSAADVERSDLVILVEPRELPENAVRAIRERVSGGAGLMVFLGPSTDLEFFNQYLFDPLGQGIATRELREVVNVRETGRLTGLTGLLWEHPVLSRFADPSFGDPAVAGFGAYFSLSGGSEHDRERVLARFQDGTPAIIESDFGVGRVMLLNTSANDAWSDLPRRRGFVPLLDGMIDYLAGTAAGGRFRVGTPLRLALPHDVLKQSVRFTGSGDKSFPLDAQRQGGRFVARIGDVPRAGVYTLEFETERGDTVREPVVVQSGRAQSAMPAMDNDVLNSWWKPAAFSVSMPDIAEKHTPVFVRGRMEAWLLVLAILALIVETVLCCRVCPRAKPVIVAESIVARRGFFKHRDDPARKDPSGEEALS